MRIFVRQLTVPARIGANDDETGRLQPVVIDIEAHVAFDGTDRIEAAVDYCRLADAARTLAAGEHVTLVETFAALLAERCLAIPGVIGIDVTVTKPRPLAPAIVGARAMRGSFE